MPADEILVPEQSLVIHGEELPDPRRASRRRFITGAAAATGAAVASTYVRPDLKSFGIPLALAQSGGVLGGPCDARATIGIELDVTANPNLISGAIHVFNLSVPCVDLDIGTLFISVRPRLPVEGTCGNEQGNPTILASSSTSTGGSNPITLATSIPAVCSGSNDYTFALTPSVPLVCGVLYKVTLELTGDNPVCGPINACASADNACSV